MNAGDEARLNVNDWQPTLKAGPLTDRFDDTNGYPWLRWKWLPYGCQLNFYYERKLSKPLILLVPPAGIEPATS